MVSAKEEPNSPLPPAVDGLLRVHKRVVDGLDNDSTHPSAGAGGKASTRLLVPAAQAGSLIGKQGTTVKSIQEDSNCVVRVLGAGVSLSNITTCVKLKSELHVCHFSVVDYCSFFLLPFIYFF